MKKITFLLIAFMLANIVNATVFYVLPGGAGVGNGADWENAADLTTATLALGENGDQFWVKAGTYNNAVTVAFGREMYGGFDGTETSLEQRDWAKNKTIIQGIAGTTPCLVMMEESSIVDGFYIQDNQRATGDNGGGVTMKFKTTLRNCVVRNNSVANANVGGGIFVTNTDKDGVLPTIENCLIYNNSAANNGAGIQVVNDGKLHLINSTIANNKITKNAGTTGSGYGCGIGLPPNARLIAENSIVFNNGKPNSDGTTTLMFSLGANHNANNNKISTIRNCAYDAINTGNGTTESVVFTETTNCIADLSASKLPGFVSPTDFIGCISTGSAEYNQILNADYRLTSISICIDGGNNSYATLTKDLAGNARVYNTTIDMGAYEYNTSTPGTGFKNNFSALNLYIVDNLLTITELSIGDDISIYDAFGKTVFSSRTEACTIQMLLPAQGIYIVKLNNQSKKIIF